MLTGLPTRSCQAGPQQPLVQQPAAERGVDEAGEAEQPSFEGGQGDVPPGRGCTQEAQGLLDSRWHAASLTDNLLTVGVPNAPARIALGNASSSCAPPTLPRGGPEAFECSAGRTSKSSQHLAEQRENLCLLLHAHLLDEFGTSPPQSPNLRLQAKHFPIQRCEAAPKVIKALLFEQRVAALGKRVVEIDIVAVPRTRVSAILILA
mmetsp:Transcript_104888/g.266369  ORF Transcript_104888/g.266369 Transcript_104888/m.266369 type:complete len:206 (-) Transcript_104888:182-799(-)